MEIGSRSWDELDVLGMGTIYEEDEDLSSSYINTPEFSVSSTPTKISRMRDQDLALRPMVPRDQEVNVYVQDACFRLHQKPLIGRSEYLRRHLNDVPEITLAPPLNLTAQTFSLVADFCYGADLAITPFNVAALRTAAEILGMTAISASGDENLLQKTENYLRRVVDVNGECASIVLESCFSLLPEAETAAALVSRCLETWSITIGGEGRDLSCLDGFKWVTIDELDLILSALSRRLSQSHDILYTIIDIHLKGNMGKVNEDQKTQMCNYIDCSILSPRVLMHAVNNSAMPLRFVLQAMFMEQLNTRHYIISDPHQIKKQGKKEDPVTLGSILQHEAALRQVADLKAAMNATNSRIQLLEKELSTMRKLLSESESMRSRIDSGRSASFRLISDGRKIERNQKGSISSISYRDMKSQPASMTDESSSEKEKRSGRGFIKGLMIALRLQKKKNDGIPLQNDALKIANPKLVK